MDDRPDSMPNGGRRPRDVDQAYRLERGLIAVRWFAAVFAFFQVFQGERLEPLPPDYVAPIGYGLAAALAAANALLSARLRRSGTITQIRQIGLVAFAIDIAVVTGLIWLYSYDENNTVWVAAYILPLEGAIRYQLTGALVTISVFTVSETLREVYVASTQDDYSFLFANVSFRVGIGAIIALVAGFMARSLEQAAEKAKDRARLAEEAARRTTIARRELQAFHGAILAGVAAEDLDASLREMAASIGRDLSFECLSILLVEDDELVAMARHGEPPSHWRDRIPIGTSVAGRAAEGVKPVLERLPEGGAAAAAPLVVGGQLIGVLEVSGSDPPAVTGDTLDLLVRLADQIALVVHSAELRARQQETLERLRELDQMKSDFVAITSHELRTPLTAVRGFVRTLIRNYDRLSSKQVTDFLSLIDRQSDRLTRLVEDLLVASRIEAGKMSVAPKPVEVRGLLADIVRSFGEQRDRIRLAVEASVPVRVTVDPNRLDQVLSNLLHNAIKFSPQGTPVSLSAVAGPDGQLELRVRDEGIGIAPEQLDHIFDRFHQAAPALTREAEGAGLGLYITKRLVEAMDGEVRVESALGEGSTFLVVLPLQMPQGLTAVPFDSSSTA